MRYGARFAKQSNLPILVADGAPDKTDSKDLAEVEVMKTVLEKEYSISPNWIEDQSNTTQVNALQLLEIIKKDALKSIYLFTHLGKYHEQRLFLQSKA